MDVNELLRESLFFGMILSLVAYKIGFEEEFTFEKDVPKDSTLTFKICVYKDGAKTILATAETYTASSTLFWLSGYDVAKEQYFTAMDSEDNWTDWIQGEL